MRKKKEKKNKHFFCTCFPKATFFSRNSLGNLQSNKRKFRHFKCAPFERKRVTFEEREEEVFASIPL